MSRILVVEDDPSMQRVLRDNLQFLGHEVRLAATGGVALQAVREQAPDLMLLDIMLPEVDGYEVCRRMRRQDLDFPIIMLTAKGQELDVVHGLNVGADDYVTKPFNLNVLLARVEVCLRRRQANDRQNEIFGEYRLDRTARRLWRGDDPIELKPKEYQLLDFFLRHPGQALTRSRILDGVWGQELIVTERSVDRCVTTLRQRIESDPRRPRFIHTLRDVGYRFDAGLEAL